MISSMSRALLFSIIFVLSIAPAFATGGEEGLYDPVPPEGSAFIRFIHADKNASELTPKVNGRVYDAAIFAAVKPYAPVPQGEVSLSLGSYTTTGSVKEKKYYSAVFQNEKLTLVEEAYGENLLKAQLVVYNLSKTPNVSLKTQDGKISVAGPIAPGEQAAREVNPVKVAFAFFSGDQKIGDLEDKPLERGAKYAIVLFDGPGGKPKIVYEKVRISSN